MQHSRESRVTRPRSVWRAALAVVAVALLSAPTVSGAEAESAGVSEWRVPSETCLGLWIVPVTVGERGVLQMVLDTGAEGASIDPDALERISGKRVAPGRNVRLHDASVGPYGIGKLRARVHPMDHLELALGRSFDGILGMETFENVLLSLDYPGGEVRIGRGKLPDVDGRTVFADLGHRRPVIGVATARETLSVLVDSGSTRGLTLRRADVVEWESAPRPVGASVRYQTVDVNHAGRTSEDISFGPRTIDRPVVMVTDAATRLAGHDVLRHFNWTFDRRNRRMRLIAHGDDPIALDPLRGSGLVVRPLAAGMEILTIPDGSPASASELRVGDLVVAANGKALAERGCESLASPDRESTLFTVRRGAELLDLQVPIGVLVP